MSYLEFIRIAYGVLMFLTLVGIIPQAKRFFLSEEYGGYFKSGRWFRVFHSPFGITLILIVWILSAAGLILDIYPVTSALVNLVFSHYFFVATRWKSILRGMGAPGFIAFWLGALVLFTQYSLYFDSTGVLLDRVLLVFRVDFGVIMLVAGFYKLISGYRHNQGMEFGLVNPWWGYWWKIYKKISPGSFFFKFLNFSAYSNELLAGALMALPYTAPIGGIIIGLSFVFILSQIRLGWLGEMIVVISVLYFGPWLPDGSLPATFFIGAPWLNQAVYWFLTAYLLLVPIAYGVMYYNFLLKRRLPMVIQTIADFYINLFGMILWRVFSADITNFFVRIYLQEEKNGERREYRNWLRFRHVGEFIALASIFTTLKYYPDNFDLFKERILRYAKTINTDPRADVVFQYFSIQKNNNFEFIPVAEFIVNAESGSVREVTLRPDFSVRAKIGPSPIVVAGQPGTYAPK